MIRWSPNTELASLHGAMDRLFEDFFGPGAGGAREARPGASSYFLPLDIREQAQAYEIQAPVAGFKPEEVEVTFADGVLRIHARHSGQGQEERGGYIRREIAYGDYQRAIQLPGDVREDDISASFEDGVLTVTVPKAPRPEPKRIQIGGRSQRQLAETPS